MFCLKETLRYNACSNCGIRINAAIAAIVPLIDQAQLMWPTLQPHLPGNMYSVGFVALAMANLLMQFRIKPPKDL